MKNKYISDFKNAFLSFSLLMFRIGENNLPFSFATFSNPEEETLNASPYLDSNGTLCQQVRLHLETKGLVDLAVRVHLVSSFRL